MNKFIISLSLLFLAGCSLKEKDVAILTTQNSLNTQADVALFVNGCYAPFTSYGGFKGGFMTFFLRADEMYYGGSSINAYTTKSDDATTSQTANIWASFYNVIENANFLMVNIQPLQIDSSYKARIIGECYFLRAFSYYYLVKDVWGCTIKTTTNYQWKQCEVS